MEKCIIYYEHMMEFITDVFKVGDTVRWMVVKPKEGSRQPDIDRKIDYFCSCDYYKDCSEIRERMFIAEGRVERIELVYDRLGPLKDHPDLWDMYNYSEKKRELLVPVSHTLIDADHAEHFEAVVDGMKSSAYVVELADPSIRAAEQEDIDTYIDKVNG